MRLFQILSGLMGLAFLWFVYVQLNDQDASLWIGAYGAVAAVSFLAAARLGPYWLAAGLAVGLGGLLVSILEPSRAFDLDDEVVREELGLALSIGWLAIVAVVRRFAKGRSKKG